MEYNCSHFSTHIKISKAAAGLLPGKCLNNIVNMRARMLLMSNIVGPTILFIFVPTILFCNDESHGC